MRTREIREQLLTMNYESTKRTFYLKLEVRDLSLDIIGSSLGNRDEALKD